MANRLRNNGFGFFLSDDEWSVLQHKVKIINTDYSKFLRQLIMDGIIIKYEITNLDYVLNEIRRIGNEINLIAKLINVNDGNYTVLNINHLRNLHNELLDLVIDNFYK